MKTTITRRLEFDAGHRIVGHENKCKYLHGHRYILEVTFCAKKLDNIGRVIDFGRVKQILGEWIDEHLDHNLILSRKDKELGDRVASITGQKVYYLDCNPTAENIAQYIYLEILPELFQDEGIIFDSIKLYETPNCYSVVSACED